MHTARRGRTPSPYNLFSGPDVLYGICLPALFFAFSCLGTGCTERLAIIAAKTGGDRLHPLAALSTAHHIFTCVTRAVIQFLHMILPYGFGLAHDMLSSRAALGWIGSIPYLAAIRKLRISTRCKRAESPTHLASGYSAVVERQDEGGATAGTSRDTKGQQGQSRPAARGSEEPQRR